MTARGRLAGALGVVVLAAAPTPAAAQSTIDFTISGSSTVRNWTCNAQGTVAVTPASGGTAVPGFPAGVQTAVVTVPLKAFRCPNDEMTQHLNEAMRSDKFPEIVYRLEKYEVAGGQTTATGSMTVTGVTAPVAFPVTLSATPNGTQVEGNTRLEFATFKLDPPTVFLGMLKVGPQIRVGFKGVVAR
ncbi:MAG: YceI family protein [Vicinamibacterales bacterium]